MSRAFENENREIAKGLELPEPSALFAPPPNGPQPRTRLGRFGTTMNSNPKNSLSDD